MLAGLTLLGVLLASVLLAGLLPLGLALSPPPPPPMQALRLVSSIAANQVRLKLAKECQLAFFIAFSRLFIRLAY